jgi:hypothetical protein
LEEKVVDNKAARVTKTAVAQVARGEDIAVRNEWELG